MRAGGAGGAGGTGGTSGVGMAGARETAVGAGTSGTDTSVTSGSTGGLRGASGAASVVSVVAETERLAGDLVVAAVIAVKALGTALEVVPALLAAAQSTALGLELVDADGRESGGTVVLSSVVMDLMDGDGGVHNLRLDHLLVEDGLNLLMDVVVNMLALNTGGLGLSDLGLGNVALIAELATLSLETLTGVVVVAVVELPGLGTGHAVLVLLRKDLLVEDGLDGAVVVVLVHLLVDNRLLLLDAFRLHRLLGDGRTDVLVDGGVMLASHALNVVDCLSCLVHYD